MKMNFTVPVAALIAGAAIGYCCAPRGAAPESAPEPKGEAKVVKVGLSDKASVDAMRARIKELERQLAERGNDLFDDPGEPAEERVAREERPRRGEGRRARGPGEWLENLKRDNPERYTQVTNDMANFRRMRQAHAQSRLEFLASVDTSRMSEAERATHERLQTLLAQREELMDKMDSAVSGNSVTEEEQREMGRTMWEATGEIMELNRQERENLIKQTAEALGFEGEDVGEIADTIKAIIETTESGFGGFGGRGPGGGGRGPGGGRR